MAEQFLKVYSNDFLNGPYHRNQFNEFLKEGWIVKTMCPFRWSADDGDSLMVVFERDNSEDQESEPCPVGGCLAKDYSAKSIYCHRCIEGVRGDDERKERQEQDQ